MTGRKVQQVRGTMSVRNNRYLVMLAGLMLGAAIGLTGCADSVTEEGGVSIALLEPESEEAPSGANADAAADELPSGSAGAATENAFGSTSASAATQGQTEPPREVQITVSATGDVSLGNYIGQGYDLSFDQTYEKAADAGYFFENVREIFEEDDFTIVNLECVLTESETPEPGRTFHIKGKPEYAAMLSGADVEAVGMANNHRMDFGEAGVQDTIAALEEEGIPYAYNEKLGWAEAKGIKIGWVSVNEVSQGKAVEAYLEEGIASLREAGAELVLASCHWGIEREYVPEDYQRELGRKCIDWGADLVLGHHPHVLQGIECYRGSYIVYSLGNFCFSANRNPADKDTMIFQQTFTFTEMQSAEASDVESRQWQLTGEAPARVIPCRISSVASRNDYKPTPLVGEEGQRVINRLNEWSEEFGVVIEEDGTVTVK